jgi:hypothetical protein
MLLAKFSIVPGRLKELIMAEKNAVGDRLNYEVLVQLRGELALAATSLKTCQAAHRSMKACRDNRKGLVFCATQLHEAAQALLGHAEQLAAITEHIQRAYRQIVAGVVRPEEVLDLRVDSQREV